jgi:hypothetical protein
LLLRPLILIINNILKIASDVLLCVIFIYVNKIYFLSLIFEQEDKPIEISDVDKYFSLGEKLITLILIFLSINMFIFAINIVMLLYKMYLAFNNKSSFD